MRPEDRIAEATRRSLVAGRRSRTRRTVGQRERKLAWIGRRGRRAISGLSGRRAFPRPGRPGAPATTKRVRSVQSDPDDLAAVVLAAVRARLVRGLELATGPVGARDRVGAVFSTANGGSGCCSGTFFRLDTTATSLSCRSLARGALRGTGPVPVLGAARSRGRRRSIRGGPPRAPRGAGRNPRTVPAQSWRTPGPGAWRGRSRRGPAARDRCGPPDASDLVLLAGLVGGAARVA